MLFLRTTFAAIVILGLSWHAALATHELGHVLHAKLTDGRVVHIDLPPLGFSSTFVDPNPHPLIVVIGGPLWGCLLPLALHPITTLASPRHHPRKLNPTTSRFRDLTRFFAAFCLLLNGSYIGLGWIDRVGDAGDMIRLGVPAWSLALAGAAGIATGLFLLHRMGPRVGLPKLFNTPWPAIAILAMSWFIVLICEFLLGTWTLPLF